MLSREYRLDFPGAQWLRIRLSMQGTWVQSLVWENPTCHGATKSKHHNSWSQYALEPVLCNKSSHHNEKAHTPQWCVASARRRESSLCSPTRESPWVASKNQCSQKKKKKKNRDLYHWYRKQTVTHSSFIFIINASINRGLTKSIYQFCFPSQGHCLNQDPRLVSK